MNEEDREKSRKIEIPSPEINREDQYKWRINQMPERKINYKKSYLGKKIII